MGGDSFMHSVSSTEEESSLDEDFPHESMKSSFSSGDEEGLSTMLEEGSAVSGGSGLNFGEFPDVDRLYSSILEAEKRQRVKVYADVLRSYEELQSRIEKLEEAKNNILSYTPGSWVEKAGGMDLRNYVVPDTTSLLLIGPKGSGKSSLVNKISRVLEDDMFGSERAQVSYNPSSGDGTYFLHGYKIPRGSDSFVLYDTRSLSDDSSENVKMLKHWMTRGVRHGALVKRKSDSRDLQAHLKCKARRSCSSTWIREINFVIFVVNGIAVLESMGGHDIEMEKQFSQLMATTFNNPLLSFQDDKPVVVVTHGDLLSLSERVRIRVYLGELLGIPPTSQIFDIPESNDSATTLTIVDMLNHCLERADRNLPVKDWSISQVISFLMVALLMVLMIYLAVQNHGSHYRQPR